MNTETENAQKIQHIFCISKNTKLNNINNEQCTLEDI